MAIAFVCQCGKELRANEAAAGKHVKCPACGGALTVPLQATTTTTSNSPPPPAAVDPLAFLQTLEPKSSSSQNVGVKSRAVRTPRVRKIRDRLPHRLSYTICLAIGGLVLTIPAGLIVWKLIAGGSRVATKRVNAPNTKFDEIKKGMSKEDALQLLDAAVEKEWSGQEVSRAEGWSVADLTVHSYKVGVGVMDETGTFAKQFQLDVKDGVVIDINRDGF